MSDTECQPEHALPPAIFLMGPTASGKTDMAIALCDMLPCDIISVDSAMIYRAWILVPQNLMLKSWPEHLIA